MQEYAQYSLLLTNTHQTIGEVIVDRAEMHRLTVTINTRRGFVDLRTGDKAGARFLADHIIGFMPVGAPLKNPDAPPEVKAPTTATCRHPDDKREYRKKGDPPVFWKVCVGCGLKMGRIHKSNIPDPDAVKEYEGD